MALNTDLESRIATDARLTRLLQELRVLPEGYQCDVHLHRGNRKKRRDAEFEANWDPDTDSIRIAFSPMEEEDEPGVPVTKVRARGSSGAPAFDDRLVELVRALDRAENRPGYEFVSLKWFRDTALSQETFGWASDSQARHDLLRDAIDSQWILTRKVPNPKTPSFPVTAIRVNRQNPDVSAALGQPPGRFAMFQPVRIKGDLLSSTVLRDRR